MTLSIKNKLRRIHKRLAIDRLVRYLQLWTHYLWRRLSAVTYRKNPGITAADIAGADQLTAQRVAVQSWFPLDLVNANLHLAILKSVAEARPDLGITSEVLEC